MTSSPTVELYYDPFDYAIDDDPYPVWKRMRRRSAAVLQRQVQLLCAEPLRRRRASTAGLADVSIGTRHHGRHPVQRHRSAAGNLAVRGPAAARSAPAVCCLGSSRHGGCWPWKTWCVTSVRAHWIRCATPTGFDFVADLGAFMPMRTIGYLLGIPEEGQQQIRDRNDKSITVAAEQR